MNSNYRHKVLAYNTPVLVLMLFILQYQKHGDGKQQATLQADVGFKLLLSQDAFYHVIHNLFWC
jgi:hypothetical protein